MLHKGAEELFEASASLDKVLSTATQRRLLFFKPSDSTTNPINSIVDTTAMRIFFSHLPILTTSIQIFGVEERSSCDFCSTTGNGHSQPSVELAVAVQPTILSRQIHSFLKTFVEETNLTCSRNFDIPLHGFKAITRAPPSEWIENKIILCSSLIAQLPQNLIPLMLLLLPEHEGLWGVRRDKLHGARPRRTLLHMHQDRNNNTTQHTAKPNDFLMDCVKEFLLTDLLLSFFYKSKTIWFHREWILKLMIENHLLTHQGGALIPQFTNTQGMCCFSRATGENSGHDMAEKSIHTKETLDLLRFLKLDDEVLSFASDKHPMNYNAWQYCRARLILLCCCSYYCRPLSNAKHPLFRDLLQHQAEDVMSFVEIHNADSSACSFLLFLLHQCASVEGEDLPGGGNAAELACGLGTLTAEMPLSVTLWRRLLCFTQRELRRHVEKGHEGMWHLRLGLIHYALSVNSRKPPVRHQLLSAWTVADELKWITIYIEGFRDTIAMGVGSGGCDRGLLAPCGDPAQAWVESSGSGAWSSYLATRYGLQLLCLLQSFKFSEV